MTAITISPDLPELRLFAQLAGVAPSRLAAAFSNPEQMPMRISLEELARLKEACDRMSALLECFGAAVEITRTTLDNIVKRK